MGLKKVFMTDFKRRICELDAESISYYRRNPVIAARDLLGIELTDNQKYMLQSSWNASHIVWCCGRNLGKSFVGAIFMILKAVLYENQAIYIVSSVGNQSKETFDKIEEIVLRIGKTAASIKSLKDIIEKEVKTSPTNKTGFSHNPASYEVSFYNGSSIYTLNGSPNNNRSRRATMVFFDEAAFCSGELISICEAFATQNTEFVTSIEDNYNPKLEPRKVPTQLVYASSQDGIDTTFYKHYKNFAAKMIAGDRDYFVCDMTCEVAINTYMYGKKYTPLLSRSKVDAALKSNRDKALREYYNQPTRDTGDGQIIKWSTVKKNEKFYLPTVCWKPNSRIVMAFDPARMSDNSILGVMNVYEDNEFGWCGDVINFINFIDENSEKKYKLDSTRQVKRIRETLLMYNGEYSDYEYIDSLLIDAGAGGGGISTYGDELLKDWEDKTGNTHRGLIDANNEIYKDYAYLYPNAIDKVRIINPKKYRTQMVEEFIELFNNGVIRLPHEYKGDDYIRVLSQKGDEEQFEAYELSDEEKLALAQIDLMKNEITSIHKTQNTEHTKVSYALAKHLENRMHDDRFYVMILLAHRLYEIRRGSVVSPKEDNFNATDFFSFKKPVLRKSRAR